ncbi:bacterio-opsin activator domain-containing protein [Halorussus lipolyticus]|uniref:bacterio-opsin activator domain-containing protein n=1 Tax=Halorussus lipolyticus TaxID=3034024 RepID=UPI0023E82E77|nr:bacterio-opsin activator domain-containing protein [Halorussus sp. DT80]
MDDLDATDRDSEYVRRLEAAVETTADAILVKDTEGRYQFANGATGTLLDYDPEEVVGRTDDEVFGPEAAGRLCEHETAVLETETERTFEVVLPVEDDEQVFEATCSPYYDADGGLAGTVCVYRNVTDQRVRERRLENQRDELETLDRINEVAQEVVRTLIGEPTRDEIAQAVCDHLVKTELYQVAWVGEPSPNGSKMTNVVGAGLDDQTRDLIDSIDASEDSIEPVPRAYYDGETHVVQSVPDDDSLPEQRREDILERGDRSGIAVPIRYGDTTYGVLSVGSDRLSAFSDRETDAFEVLGEVIGFAIGAVKHRRLALSDAVVELKFRLTDTESFYVAVTDELGCRLALEGMAAGPDGNLLFYDTVAGADTEEVLDYADEWDNVEDARLVSDRDDESLVEFTMSGSSLVVTLSEYGAKTKSATSEDGESTIVAELPADADVRSVVERVQTKFPDVELVAKREQDRQVRTTRDFRQDFDERLTDAQRTALRAAYFAGYYEWPRDSTAEEVADALGVSSPTFHQHIRKAQRELLGAFFDWDGDRP